MSDDLLPSAPPGMPEPAVTLPGRMTLNQLLPGEQYEPVRRAIIEDGKYVVRAKGTGEVRKELRVHTRAMGDGDYEVLAIGAVSRDPGAANDFISGLADYQTATRSRSTYVPMLWNIYENHGLVNNAINKQAALVAAGGEFVIRQAKRGKSRNASETAQQVLFWWTRMVNAPVVAPKSQKSAPQVGVITGSRGWEAMVRQGTRVALVEGSWVAKHKWDTVTLPGLGSFDMPTTIHTISTQYLEPVQDVVGTVLEYFNWIPPTALLQQIRAPRTKEIEKLIKRLVSPEDYKTLQREQKVPIDPALLLHVKNRSRDGSPFGESSIQPVMTGLAYEQSILRLDTVAMQNLINRLTILMVGSDDPTSPYSKNDVALARAALLQQLIEDPGPSMTIVWAGRDIDVKDVSAHSAVLQLDDRLKYARQCIKEGLGVSEALLTGAGTDSKATGWASTLGTKAALDGMSEQFANVATTLGELILNENGFTDIHVDWVFNDPLLDRTEDRQLARAEYTTGYRSIRSTIKSMNLDPDLEFQQVCVEKGLNPESTLWKDAFTPVMGLPGQGTDAPPGQSPATPNPNGAPGQGRTPKTTTTKVGPDRRKENPAPTEPA